MVKTRNESKRTMAGRPVNLQLDYFMSTQFAGVAVAESKGFYRTMNINLELLPTVDVGLEAASVRQHYDAKARKELVVGTCEQNILIPVFKHDASLKLKAVAAMFGRTPLCIAAKVSQIHHSLCCTISPHFSSLIITHRSPPSSLHHRHRRVLLANQHHSEWVLMKTQWLCFKYCCRLQPW